MDRIINLNNMGANCLDCGNIQMGMKYLSKALHMSNEVVSLSSTQNNNNNNASSQHIQIDDWMEGTASSIDEDDAVVGGDPSHYFVYSRPIYIPTPSTNHHHHQHFSSSSKSSSSSSSTDATMTTEEEETIEESNYSMVAGTIVFNLALSFLLQGRYCDDTTDSSSCSKYDEKSLKLFQCALQLAERTPHCTSKVTFFAMATLNNIRFLYYRLGRHNDANHCQQKLTSALVSMMMMTTTDNDGSTSSSTALSKYEGFFRLLIDPTCSSACAGAA